MRVPEKLLKSQVDNLNRQAGFENPEYSTIGAYCLNYAYGGVQLHQCTNKSGGIRDIFGIGFMPKKELYNLISAYQAGMDRSQWKRV